MRSHPPLGIALLSLALGCGGETLAPHNSSAPVALPAPPSTAQRVDFTVAGGGLSLAGDAKGPYQDGVCGVVGTWGSGGIHLAPAEGKIPKSQQAACTGIAPRAATLTLALRHLSDDPHVDDAAAPAGSGVFPVGNVKFGAGAAQATTINSSAACGTAGLRFTSVTYPGTNDVVRVDQGGGVWRMFTLPWPDNKAYCNGAYWHVSLDLVVQIK